MKRLAILTVVILGAATALSALPISVLRWPRHFAPEADYNPIDDIKSWSDGKYLREHGSRFVGSQSRTESADIRRLVDMDVADEPARRKRLEAAYLVDFAAVCCLLVVSLVGFLRRRADQMKESALNAAADGVRVGRKVKSTAQALGDKIRTRADDRAK